MGQSRSTQIALLFDPCAGVGQTNIQRQEPQDPFSEAVH